MSLPSFAYLAELADAAVQKAQQGLPEPLQGEAIKIPVTYQEYPHQALLDEGWEDDLLGLYIGGTYVDAVEGGDPLPAQIFLFLANLWEFAEERERLYQREVRKTYLHELGHYLGLDEEDLAQRGLE